MTCFTLEYGIKYKYFYNNHKIKEKYFFIYILLYNKKKGMVKNMTKNNKIAKQMLKLAKQLMSTNKKASLKLIKLAKALIDTSKSSFNINH